MYKAICFGRRIVILMLALAACCVLAVSASAAMADLDAELVDRQATAVHYSASTASSVIGQIEDGSEVEILGQSGNFRRVDCAGMTGYIAADQIIADDNGHYYVSCREDSPQTRTLPGIDAKDLTRTMEQAVAEAEKQLGVPYVWGGTTPRGFDCSGFTRYVYSQLGYSINRTATAQLQDGIIVPREELMPGDLVFFSGTSGQAAIATHVGIYVGEGRFIHAGSRGICYASLDSAYFASSYLCARRVILSGVAQFRSLPEEPISRNSSRNGWNFLFLKEQNLPAIIRNNRD